MTQICQAAGALDATDPTPSPVAINLIAFREPGKLAQAKR